MYNFGADLILDVENQALLITKNGTTVDIQSGCISGCQIEEYVTISYKYGDEEADLIPLNNLSNVKLGQDGKATVNLLQIQKDLNRTDFDLVVYLMNVFNVKDGSDYPAHIASIREPLYIELGNVLNNSCEQNDTVANSYLKYQTSAYLEITEKMLIKLSMINFLCSDSTNLRII